MAAPQVDPRVNDEMTRVQLRLVKEKLQQQRKNLSGKEEKVHDDADTRLDKVIKRRDELISRIRQEHKLRDELEGRPRSVENSLPPEPIQIMPAPVMPAVYPPVPPYVYPLSPRKPSGKKDSMKDFIMYQNSQMQQMLLQQLMGRGEKQGYELGDLLKLLPLGGQPTEKGRTVHHHYYQQPSTFPPQNNWPPYPMLPPIGQPAQPPPMNGQPMGFNMNTFQSATVPPLTDNTQPYNPYMGYQASELSETESIPKRSPSVEERVIIKKKAPAAPAGRARVKLPPPPFPGPWPLRKIRHTAYMVWFAKILKNILLDKRGIEHDDIDVSERKTPDPKSLKAPPPSKRRVSVVNTSRSVIEEEDENVEDDRVSRVGGGATNRSTGRKRIVIVEEPVETSRVDVNASRDLRNASDDGKKPSNLKGGAKPSEGFLTGIQLKECVSALHNYYTNPNGKISNILQRATSDAANDFKIALLEARGAQKEAVIKDLDFLIEKLTFEITEIMPKAGVLGTHKKAFTYSLIQAGRTWPSGYFWSIEKRLQNLDRAGRTVKVDDFQALVILAGIFIGRALVTTCFFRPLEYGLIDSHPTARVESNLRILATIFIYILRKVYSDPYGAVTERPTEIGSFLLPDDVMKPLFERLKDNLTYAENLIREWGKEYIRRLRNAR